MRPNNYETMLRLRIYWRMVYLYSPVLLRSAQIRHPFFNSTCIFSSTCTFLTDSFPYQVFVFIFHPSDECCLLIITVSSYHHHHHPRQEFHWRTRNQLDATCYFIVFLIGSTSFGHYYTHHQELATMMLITTLVVSFLVCCMLEVRCG